MELGDLDGDNDLDLAVANGFSTNVSVLLGNGDGTFAEPVDYGAGFLPAAVAVADLDGDLDLDLTVANTLSDDISVLLNTCGACPFDLDVNGKVDVVDLLLLLGDFGSCNGSSADFDGDGMVNGLDAAAVATHFGPCP